MANYQQNKRRAAHRSAGERESLLAEYRASGESASSFCGRRNIPNQTFYSWLSKSKIREPRNKPSQSLLPESKFIKVKTESLTKRTEEEVENATGFFKVALRFGSVLELIYERSFKCPKA